MVFSERDIHNLRCWNANTGSERILAHKQILWGLFDFPRSILKILHGESKEETSLGHFSHSPVGSTTLKWTSHILYSNLGHIGETQRPHWLHLTILNIQSLKLAATMSSSLTLRALNSSFQESRPALLSGHGVERLMENVWDSSFSRLLCLLLLFGLWRPCR